MEFEVIKVSEANVDWEEEDREYHGVLPGYVAGFNYEIENDEGELRYMDCYYMNEDPTDFINNLPYDYFEMRVLHNGFKPTGRVVFRGYGTEYYNEEFHDWCIEDTHEEAISLLKKYGVC